MNIEVRNGFTTARKKLTIAYGTDNVQHQLTLVRQAIEELRTVKAALEKENKQ